MTSGEAGQAMSAKETARIEAFSDGVFAMAITLLILEIKVPHHSETGAGLGAQLLRQWPSYVAFLTSFATIGIMWINHHRLFTHIERSNHALLILNGLLLLGITVVPFPTAVVAEYIGHEGQQVAAMVYTGTFLTIAIFSICCGGTPQSVCWARMPTGARCRRSPNNTCSAHSSTSSVSRSRR
jgi:uncharacterized membrane protein